MKTQLKEVTEFELNLPDYIRKAIEIHQSGDHFAITGKQMVEVYVHEQAEIVRATQGVDLDEDQIDEAVVNEYTSRSAWLLERLTASYVSNIIKRHMLKVHNKAVSVRINRDQVDGVTIFITELEGEEAEKVIGEAKQGKRGRKRKSISDVFNAKVEAFRIDLRDFEGSNISVSDLNKLVEQFRSHLLDEDKQS